MKINRRNILLSTLGAIGTMPLVGGASLAGKENNSLVWTSFTPPSLIDPYFSVYREINIVLAQLIWDGLVYQNPDTLEYEPLLAESWGWVNDKTLRFKLRNDVTWHNGDKFTASDVVATYNYIADPANKAANQQNIEWIKSAEKIDDHTVLIHLKNPFEPALQYLSQVMAILPKEFYGTKLNSQATERFVGTGPYRLAEFIPGSSVTLIPAERRLMKSPKHDPSFSKIAYRALPDQSTQIAELLNGGVDWAWLLPPEQVEQLKQRRGLAVASSPTMRVSYLSYNVGDMPNGNPLKDKRVREAITLALNKDEIVKYVIGEGAQVATTPCHPTQFGCSQDVAIFKQDLKKAKALLAEAGYPKGFTLDLAAQRNRAWTEAIAAQIEQIGIKVNIIFGQASMVDQKQIEGSVHMVHSDFGSYAIKDVSAILNAFFAGDVKDWSHDKALADLLLKAQGSLDRNERKALYKVAINKIVDECYWTPLWYHPLSYVYKSDLDFKPYPDENPRFFLAKWKP